MELEFFKGKRVLVTGHTGFKGSWLTQILVEAGAEVCGYALKPNTQPNMFDALNLETKIVNYFGDIRDLEKFNQVVASFKPEIIFHLAAQPLVRDSYDDPVYTYEANVMGTVNVLEAIRQNNVKVGVIITTDKVYKNLEIDYAYNEDDPLGGHDPYSSSKACADISVSSYISSFFNPEDFGKKHKTLVASCRGGNVIGGGDWSKDRLVPDAVRAMLENKVDLVIRNPKSIRPWQHVLELISGYLTLAEHLFKEDLQKIGAYNFGPEEKDMQDVETVLKLIIGEFGKGNYVIKPDKTKHEAGILKLNNSKSKELLGWKPLYNLEEAVAKTAEWYKNYYEGIDMIKFTNMQIEDYFGKRQK
jgi:CDP-glucose 4,6-dehydratase